MRRRRTLEAKRAARKAAEQRCRDAWKQAGLTKTEQEDYAWSLYLYGDRCC